MPPPKRQPCSTLSFASACSIGPEVNTLKQLGPKKKLQDISTIFLDHNSLKVFAPVERLSKVKELYLDHNYLKEVDGHNKLLAGLETLSLTSNKLTTVKNLDGFSEVTPHKPRRAHCTWKRKGVGHLRASHRVGNRFSFCLPMAWVRVVPSTPRR